MTASNIPDFDGKPTGFWHKARESKLDTDTTVLCPVASPGLRGTTICIYIHTYNWYLWTYICTYTVRTHISSYIHIIHILYTYACIYHLVGMPESHQLRRQPITARLREVPIFGDQGLISSHRTKHARTSNHETHDKAGERTSIIIGIVQKLLEQTIWHLICRQQLWSFAIP